MTQERWIEIMNNPTIKLTPEELSEGYHFCVEWDGLLIGPDNPEWECCDCSAKVNHGTTDAR